MRTSLLPLILVSLMSLTYVANSAYCGSNYCKTCHSVLTSWCTTCKTGYYYDIDFDPYGTWGSYCLSSCSGGCIDPNNTAYGSSGTCSESNTICNSTSNSTNSTSSGSSSIKLGTTLLIVVIVVPVGVFLLLVICICCCIMQRKKRRIMSSRTNFQTPVYGQPQVSGQQQVYGQQQMYYNQPPVTQGPVYGQQQQSGVIYY